MIVKKEIVKAWEVTLHCDKCGAEMKQRKFLPTTPPKLEYVCESCGYTEFQTKTFPYQETLVEGDN